MAERIRMVQKETGIQKIGFYGFSWTTLFFGPFPALFRQDFKTFIGYGIIQLFIMVATLFMLGLGVFVTSTIWAFCYNKYYTTSLLKEGFVFNDTAYKNEEARRVLNLQDSPAPLNHESFE